MQKFRDNAGRTWEVAIDIAGIKRVRSLLGIDILSGLDGKGLDPITRDPVVFVDILYVLCKPEADRAGLTDEEFGRGLGGDALHAASEAFTEAFISFCPNPRDRKRLRRAVDQMSAMLEKARDSMDSTLESRVAQAVNSRLVAHGDSSGISPEPSESIPADSPCASSA
jgi:hypothetical protein